MNCWADTTYYENGRPVGRVKINGMGKWGGGYWREVGRSVAKILGDIVPLGLVSCDDGPAFNISDQSTGGREELFEYFEEQRQLTEKLRSGLNPVSGEPLCLEVFDAKGNPNWNKQKSRDGETCPRRIVR